MTPRAPSVTSTFVVGPSSRRVYVLDDVIEPSARPLLFGGLTRLQYGYWDYDRPDTKHLRHLVHRIPDEASHPLDGFVRALERSVVKFLRSRRHAVGARSRAYVNFNLFGDHQFVHDDGDEWTALLFGNDRWESDWGGELLLYEGVEEGALAWAVPPKPGRVVVFDGLIPHRGGVPSKLCPVPRISLALKMNRPARRARRSRAGRRR